MKRKEHPMAKIAAAQMRMSDNMQENFEKSIALIKEAAEKGADLIAFPEVQLSPFFPQYEGFDASGYEIPLDHPYVKGFCDACRENHIIATPNFFLKKGDKTYDANLMIDENGEILGISKMVHIAQAHQFYEQDYYTPSEEGFIVYDTSIGKVGIVICFDRHYPESIRTSALKGADLVIVPTANTKSEPMELFAWEIKIPAFQNSTNIVMVNRVGLEDEMDFAGETLYAGPSGETIFIADDQEQLIIKEVDLDAAREMRERKPYVSLRRTDLYV